MVQHHLVKSELAESQHQVGETFQRITLMMMIIVIIIIIIVVIIMIKPSFVFEICC